jgi:hypothetical protein
LDIHIYSVINNNLIDFVSLSVEWNVDWSNGEFVFVDGGNWKFVFMDWGNWELVDVDGSDGQMGTSGLETGIIGGPGQSEFLAFWGNPVGRSLVGVSVDFLFSFFAVVVDFGHDELLLFLGFLTGGVVRLGVAIRIMVPISKGPFLSKMQSVSKRKCEMRVDLLPLAAAIDVALIRLASDGDLWVFVVLSVLLFFGFVTGRSGGGDGQDSGDDELL